MPPQFQYFPIYIVKVKKKFNPILYHTMPLINIKLKVAQKLKKLALHVAPFVATLVQIPSTLGMLIPFPWHQP